MAALTTLLLVLSTLLSLTTALTPSPGCSKTTSLTSKTYTTTVNGKSRSYILTLPRTYNATHPYRLIFTYHQRGGSAAKIVAGEDINHGGALPYYGLRALDTADSSVFVVPEGLNAGWANSGGEDVSFFDAMLDNVSKNLCVDLDLVFSTGFSYGGAMSYSLACSRPKVLRAVAVLSGGVLSGCAGGNDPVAYYAQHGTSDSVLNVSGGRQMRDRFVKNNGCKPLASEPMPGSGGKSVKTVYTGCKEGYPVTWVIHGGDHNPSQTDGGQPFAPGNTWEFFGQFR
jgi:poly(3-hydroxybutyrate) depolymerase